MDLSHGELMHWSGHNVLKVFTICPKVLKEAQNTSKAKLHLVGSHLTRKLEIVSSRVQSAKIKGLETIN